MPAGLDGARDRVESAERDLVIHAVADAVDAIPPHPNVLVAIDGASGTGKSTFADELADVLTTRGRTIIRASIDSFHRPRAERYRRGTDSAEGYYRDSHDLDAIRAHLLDPLSTGRGAYVTEAFDEPSDAPIVTEPAHAPTDAVLVVDGIFVQRPELARYWDLSVFLVADDRREAAWQAYLHRDLPTDADERDAEIAARIERARRPRYVAGQARYESEALPRDRATFVIDNDDLARPTINRER